MRKIRLHSDDRGKTSVVVKPVASVAHQNGIAIDQVPALLAAWHRMGAIRPRKDGGYDVVKFVKPADPEALRLMAAQPTAPAPRWTFAGEVRELFR